MLSMYPKVTLQQLLSDPRDKEDFELFKKAYLSKSKTRPFSGKTHKFLKDKKDTTKSHHIKRR